MNDFKLIMGMIFAMLSLPVLFIFCGTFLELDRFMISVLILLGQVIPSIIYINKISKKFV